MAIITPGSTGDPAAEWKAQQTDRMVGQQAMGMPGYEQMGDIYGANYDKYGRQIGDSPDYMDRWAGMGSPQDFIGGMPGMDGGEGSYGPIGAEQLAEFGEGAYELFDKFTPGMEHIAETQGVGEQELASRLGVSSAELQANIAGQEGQATRAMGRMGIDPTSGAWQAGAGERAIEGAKGLSSLQEQVRGGAREEDWKQRMEAAGIGLNLAGQGTDALGKATGAYNQALSTYGGMYGDYMSGMSNMGSLTEQARQYDKGYGANLAQGMTGAVPAYQNYQQAGTARQSLPSANQQWQAQYQ